MTTSKYTTADASTLEDFQCQICLGTLRSCVALEPCGHNFCAPCLSHHFASQLMVRSCQPLPGWCHVHRTHAPAYFLFQLSFCLALLTEGNASSLTTNSFVLCTDKQQPVLSTAMRGAQQGCGKCSCAEAGPQVQGGKERQQEAGKAVAVTCAVSADAFPRAPARYRSA